MTATQPAPTSTGAPSTGTSFKQAAGTRRSFRFFKPYQPVEREKVQKVLEAAPLQSQRGNASAIREAVVV